MKMIRGITSVILVILFLPLCSFALTLGPYSGIVTDRGTGEPVEGASVLIYWTQYIPAPPGGYSGLVNSALVYTDRSGGYFIPEMTGDTGLFGRMEETRIIIYRPGYQAQLVSLSHLPPAPEDAQFTRLAVPVQLERVPPDFDFQGHYQRIENALSGIREEPPGDMPVREDSLRYNLKSIMEKEELLRRARWEKRRSGDERKR